MVIDFEHRGFNFNSRELERGDSEVTISRDDKIVRQFVWPTYKIFNISAHADDIVNGLENYSDSGLYLAGSTGLGDSVYQRPCARGDSGHEEAGREAGKEKENGTE